MKLSDITPLVDECRDNLDGSNADCVRRRENVNASLNNEREITRSWRDLSPDNIQIYKGYLDFYTDAKNTSTSYFVDDPLIGQEEVAPGRWRNAFVFESWDGDVPLLNQTLRYGFIESLVDEGTVDWSEARLVNTDWYSGDGGDNTKEDYKTIQWKGISPEKSHEIVASLKAIDPAGWNPTVRGESLGSHHCLHVRAVEDEDGSHTVQAILANPRSTYTSYEGRRNWFKTIGGGVKYHFKVPKDLVPTVLASEEVDGATATVSQPDQQGLCNIVVRKRDADDDQKEELKNILTGMNCRQRTYMDIYWGLSKAEANAIALTPPATVGTTHTLDKRANGDGTWDVQVRRVERQSQTRTVPDVIQESASSETTQKQHLGILPVNLPPVPPVDEGQEYRRTIRVNEDCTLDVQEDTTESKHLHVTLHKSNENAFTKSKVGTKQNLKGTELTELPPNQDEGEVKSLRRTRNSDGTYNEELQTQESVERVDFAESKTENAFEEEETQESRNLLVEPTVPTDQVAGEVKTLRKRLNDFLRWDKEERTQKAVVQANAGASVSHEAYEKRTGAEKRNTISEPVLPTAQVAGKIKSLRKRLNAFLRWDEESEEREAVLQANSGASKSITAFETTENTEGRNLSAEPDLPTTTMAGVITTLQKRLNPFLRWDKEEQTRTATTVSDAVKTLIYGPLENRESDVTRNSAGPARTATGEDGKIVTSSVEKSEFPNRINDTLETRTAKAKQVLASSGGPVVTVEEDIKRNSVAPETPGPGVDGTIHDVSNSINEFGLYDTRKATRTAQAKEVSAFSGGPLEDVEEDIKRNQVAPETPGPGAIGTINDVSNTINEFGLYDNRKRTRTAKVSGPHTSVFGGPAEEVEYETTRNLESIPTPGAGDGEIVNVSAQVNQFGRFDATVTKRKPRNQTATSYGADYFSTSQEVLNTQADAPAAQPSQVDGTVKSVQNRPTPHGKYETRESTETASAARTMQETVPRIGGDGTYYWGENADALPSFPVNRNVTLSARKNKYGKLSYSATAIPSTSTWASIPPKYSNYDTEWRPYTQIIERTVIDGVPKQRIFTNNAMRAIGSNIPRDVVDALKDADYRVSMEASADGRFFHGKGIKLGNKGSWVDDD